MLQLLLSSTGKVKGVYTHRIQCLLNCACDARRRAQDLELVAVIGDEGNVLRLSHVPGSWTGGFYERVA